MAPLRTKIDEDKIYLQSSYHLRVSYLSIPFFAAWKQADEYMTKNICTVSRRNSKSTIQNCIVRCTLRNFSLIAYCYMLCTRYCTTHTHTDTNTSIFLSFLVFFCRIREIPSEIELNVTMVCLLHMYTTPLIFSYTCGVFPWKLNRRKGET